MRRGENIFIGHGGGIHGFLTVIFFNKPHRTGVIVLTNMGGGGGAGAIALEMLDWLSEAEKETIKKAPHRKPIPTAEEWEPFLGRYQSALAALVIWMIWTDDFGESAKLRAAGVLSILLLSVTIVIPIFSRIVALDDHERAGDKAGRQRSDGIRYCPNCGLAVRASGVGRCGKCGARFAVTFDARQ